MANSIKLTDVAALRAYVEDFKEDLISLMYFDFATSKVVTPLDGIKGKGYVPTVKMEDLVRRYTSTFSPTADTIVFGQREIEVGHGKIEFDITPTDFESTWMGRFRQKGQNPMDLPFEAEIFAKAISKKSQEQEVAIWTGVKKTTGTGPTDKLVDLFDGFIAKIKSDSAGLAPVASGAITVSNAFPTVESMFESLGSQYQIEGAGTTLYVSPADYHLIGRNYRALYGAYNDGSNTDKKMWSIPGLSVDICPGLPKNKLLMTTQDNMFYGFDAETDASVFRLVEQMWGIQAGAALKMGTQTGFNSSTIMAVNDQFLL
jgi:hypothetical protein